MFFVKCEVNSGYYFLLLNFSLHAGSDNESEQLKELHALMKEELTPTERVYVRKSIEQHKLGTNRVLLKQVRWDCQFLPSECLLLRCSSSVVMGNLRFHR